MTMPRWFAAPVLCVCVAGASMPATAAPTVIARLGAAPLLGESRSTVELRSRVARAGDRFDAAASMLGLSDAEYAAFRSALFSRKLPWGVLPRHVDAMAFFRTDGVHVLHDVIMPAKTYGWEVDVAEADETVRIIVPALCGNLSVLRAFHPAVAGRSPGSAPSRVAASEETARAPVAPAWPNASSAPAAPGSAPAPAAPTGPASSPVPAAPGTSPAPATSAAPSPSPAPAASQTPAQAPTPIPTSATGTPSPPPQSHHLRWPWLIPIVLLFFHGHGGGGPSSPPAGGGCGCGCAPIL